MLQTSNSGNSGSLNQQSTAWLSPRTKAVLAGATAMVSALGIGYLIMQPPSVPQPPTPLPPECSLPGGFWCTQPSAPLPTLPIPIDYTPLAVGSMIVGLFTSAICSLTGACTKAKEEKHLLPPELNSAAKTKESSKKQENGKEIGQKSTEQEEQEEHLLPSIPNSEGGAQESFREQENGIELSSQPTEKDGNEEPSRQMDEQEVQFINEMLISLSKVFSEGINWKTDPTGVKLLEELSAHEVENDLLEILEIPGSHEVENDLLEKCKQASSYLETLELPLNHTEKRIIQTLTALLQKKICDSNGCMDKDFFSVLESVFYVLLQMDPNSAVAIAKTCFDVSKSCSVKGQCKKIVGIALKFPDIAKMLARECAKSIDHSEGNVKSILVYFLKEMNWNEPALTAFLKECAKRDDEHLLELIVDELDDVFEFIKGYGKELEQANGYDRAKLIGKWRYYIPNIRTTVRVFIEQDKYTAALALLKKCILNGRLSIARDFCNMLRTKSIETANELAQYYEEATKEKLNFSTYEAPIAVKENETGQAEQNQISKKLLLCTSELYEKIISYLKEQELPLNDDQRALVQSLVTSIETLATYQASIKDPKIKNALHEILEEAFHTLYRIDKGSAFALYVAQINGEKNGVVSFPWGFLPSDDVKQWLFSNFIRKCEDNTITKNECEAAVSYLRSISFPNSDVTLTPLIKALADFIVEKINHPAENDPLEKELPSMIKSVFDLLLYHTCNNDLVLEIAKSCVDVPGDAPENLKTGCRSIVKTVVKHNTRIAYDLILYCVKQTDELNQEETTSRLTWFFEAEKHRIINSLSNCQQREIDALYDRFPREDKYTINTSKFLRSFLKESAKIDNEVFQKCLLDAFEDIIKQELREYHNWDSAVVECVIKFLILDSVKNYDLALSLLKIYLSSTANNKQKFIKGAYEELVRESPETASQLAKHFAEINNEELVEYVEKSTNYWSSQDGTPKSHEEIEKNGIQQLCCKPGSMPNPRHGEK